MLAKIGIVLVIGVVGVLTACSSGGDSASSGTTTSTEASTTTTASAPCGGAATVSAAVKGTDAAGLGSVADKFDVTNVRIAASDATWAGFSDVAKPGVVDFQGGYGVAHCTASAWVVYDEGSAEVGCGGGTIPAVPAAVRTDLGLECPAP